MSNYLSLLAAALWLLLTISCTDSIVKPTPLDDGAVTEITAYADGNLATKTGIVDNGSGVKNVVWKAGNAISLFFISGDDGGNKFTTASGGSVASFTGTISAVVGDLTGTGGSAYYWATYPYGSSVSCDGTGITTTLRASQLAYANDVDDDLLVTIGRSPNPAIYFRNTYTMIEFTLSQENITKITFSGNNNEQVAGEFKAFFDSNNKVISTPTSNAVKSVEITPAESSTFATGTKYYFVFLPGTFSKGYTLTFTRNDGYEATYTKTTASTFEVGKYYTMTNKDSGLSFAPIPVPEAVDLGLSVKWASFNVGATAPEEYGDYFAWGETTGYNEGKTSFAWSSYVWGAAYDALTKYCNNSSYGKDGFTDTLTTLEKEDDAAYAALGGKWRMPTDAEWAALMTNCIWEWTTQNGVNGYLVTGNNNSIFLPAAGNRSDANLHYVGSVGVYWSSSLSTDYPYDAWYIFFYSIEVNRYDDRRCDGFSVRPVYAE